MVGRLNCLTLALLWVAACAPETASGARDGVLDLRGRSQELAGGGLRLDGEWEFFWRAFLHETDRRTLPPPLVVAVPNRWSSYSKNGRELPRFGFATYRLKLLLDEPQESMALRVREASSSYRLYLNGVLLLEEGRPGRNRAETIPRSQRLITAPVRLERENEILIEVANFHFHEGGLRKFVRLADAGLMQSERRTAIRVTAALLGALAFMTLYHLLLFGLDRREKAALAFAAMCIGIMFRIAMTNERLLVDVIDLDYHSFLRTLVFMTYMTLPACAFFLGELFPARLNRRIVLAITGLTGVLGGTVLFARPDQFMRTIPVYTLLVLATGLYGLYILARAARTDPADSGIFFIAFCCFLGTAMNDLLYAQKIVQTGYYAEYGFSAFVFAQAFIISRRILVSRRLSESLAADLETSNERLRSLDRLKDEFLASTSHELRTPLQGIIGIADALREDFPGERRLNLIVASGRRLAGLVSDILDFSRLRYRDVRLKRMPIDLRSFAELQLELIQYNLDDSKRLRLGNAVPPDIFVLADEARLTQIFQNLLGNAVKHTAAGEIRIEAAATAVADATGSAQAEAPANEGEMIAVEVVDTGAGIPADQLQRIFLPFEQAGRNPGGIGLGLAIARSLTELHGGRLTVASTPGAGSRFRFTLPRADAPAPVPGSERRKQAFETAPAIVSTLPRIPTAFAEADALAAGAPDPDETLVLLIDDEPVNLEVMRGFLKSAALRTVSADSAARAREIIAGQRPPDCVVLDIMMPGLSGLDFLRELRGRYAQHELPILMVTAMTRTGDLLAALEAGASDYLTKPFEKEEFLSRVSNLTALARTHRDRRKAVAQAAARERERMNADLHDHLGGSLIDLQLMNEQALEEGGHEREALERMYAKIGEVIRILRNDMLGLEDLALLEENFLEGIQLILLRRYVEAGRELDFQIDATPPPRIGPDRSQILHAVLTEVANNDLKYGSGPALFRFRSGERILIEFESRSHYRLETHGTGRGTAGMIRRLSEIGGRLQIAMDRENESETRRILLTISLPIPPGGE